MRARIVGSSIFRISVASGNLERIVDLEHPARSQVDPVDYARVGRDQIDVVFPRKAAPVRSPCAKDQEIHNESQTPRPPMSRTEK